MAKKPSAAPVIVEAKPLSKDAKTKLNRLKELIEPKTQALIDVMYHIAMNQDAKGKDLPAGKEFHPSVRLEAADRLLSRAYGKPKEHLEVTNNEDVAAQGDEVTKLLNSILASVGAPLIEGPKS